MQRPLPDIPPDKPIARSRQVSTASSAGSATPSITPSLMSCFHDGSSDEDLVELGLARVVDLAPFNSDGGCGEEEDRDSRTQQFANSSFSDYDISPPSTSDSNSDRMLSPRSYLPTTRSSFEFSLERFSSPHPRQESRSDNVGVDTDPTLPSGIFPNFSRPNRMPNPYSGDTSEPYSRKTLQFGETGWMSRTPSPVLEQNDMRRLRGPCHDLPGCKRSTAVDCADESCENGEIRTVSTGTERLSSSPTKMSTTRHILQSKAASSGKGDDSNRKTIHGLKQVAVVGTLGFGFGLNEKQHIGESGNWI